MIDQELESVNIRFENLGFDFSSLGFDFFKKVDFEKKVRFDCFSDNVI